MEKITEAICRAVERGEDVPPSIIDDLPAGCSVKVSLRWNAQPVVLEIHSADGTAVWFIRRPKPGESIGDPASADAY